jgi:hypothetical protein
MKPDECRHAFEFWYSDGFEWPQSVAREGDGERDHYIYIGAQNAWAAWQAAWIRARELAA